MRKPLIVLFFLCLVSIDAWSQGCSQCKILAEQGSDMAENSFTSNINGGILYLMAFPYVILLIIFRKPVIGFIRSFLSSHKSSQ
jgi:hypothetical protein